MEEMNNSWEEELFNKNMHKILFLGEGTMVFLVQSVLEKQLRKLTIQEKEMSWYCHLQQCHMLAAS